MGLLAVDLGNSAVKCASPDELGKPRVEHSDRGELSIPSLVFIGEGGVVVGEEARNASFENPQALITDWKRKLATEEVLVTVKGVQYRAKDASGFMFDTAVANYERKHGEKPTLVSLTVPAGYTTHERAATADIAERRKIKVATICPEPVAAALSHTSSVSPGNSCVIDLGGSTLDVAVYGMRGRTIEIIQIGGENIGGQDFSTILRENLLDVFENQHGIRVSADTHPLPYLELTQRIEQAKLTLSRLDRAKLVMTCEGKVASLSVTREQYHKWCESLLERAVQTVKKTLKEASVTVAQLTELLVVGGAGQNPSFCQALEKGLGRRPSLHADPHFAVALGAVTAGRIQVENEGGTISVGKRVLPSTNLDLTQVSAHPIGVAALNDRRQLVQSEILKKGSPLPCTHLEKYVLDQPNATGVHVEVLEGEEGALASDCVRIGSFSLKGLPPIADRDHVILIELRLDSSNFLTATAKDTISGKSEELKIEYRPRQPAAA